MLPNQINGFNVVITPERFETKLKRNRSGSHPHIHWLAKWLPINPYVEWVRREQVPCDDAIRHGNTLLMSERVYRMLKTQIAQRNPA